MNHDHFNNDQFEIPGRVSINDDRSRRDVFEVDNYTYRREYQNNSRKMLNGPYNLSCYSNISSHRQSQSMVTKLSSKMRFMVFIKIILKCLKIEDQSVCLQAKLIIAECITKNRDGHPDYTPLEDVINRRLRLVVDDCQWNRAQTLTEHYDMIKSRKKSSFQPLKSKTPRYAQV